jgi:hypothetical protein
MASVIAYMPGIDQRQARALLRGAGLGTAELLEEGAGLSDALAAAAHARAMLVLARLRDGARSSAQLAALLGWLERSGASLRVLDVDLDSAANRCGDVAALVSELDSLAREREPGLPPRGRPGIAAADPLLRERIRDLRAGGASLQAIADALNAEGVSTPRGGARWRPSSVQSALGYRRPRPPHPHLPPPPPEPSRQPRPKPRPGRGGAPAHPKGPR